MARGRRKSTEPTIILSEDEKRLKIVEGYAALYQVEGEIAALIAEHVEPLKKKRVAIWRGLKKDTATDRTDLDLGYRIYKRDRLADEMDDGDADRVKDNLRRVFSALSQGETLDWITALEVTAGAGSGEDESEGMFEDAPGGEADDLGGDAEGAAPFDGDDPLAIPASLDRRGEKAPADKVEVTAQADVGPETLDPQTDESLDDAGHIFAAGMEAGAAGAAADTSPHAAGTNAAIVWERGRAKGAKAVAQPVAEDPAANDEAAEEPPTRKRRGNGSGKGNGHAEAEAMPMAAASAGGGVPDGVFAH